MRADVDFVESKMRHQIMRFTCALNSKIKFLEKFTSVGETGLKNSFLNVLSEEFSAINLILPSID